MVRWRSRVRAGALSWKTSSPSIRTVPFSGSSSVPSKWSSVLLPTPEAPTTATISPRGTLRFAPLTTRRDTLPERKPRCKSQASSRTSLISERFRQVEPRSSTSRIDGGQEGDQRRRQHHQQEVQRQELERHECHLIDVLRNVEHLIVIQNPADAHSQEGSHQGSYHADDQTLQHEDGHDAASTGPHRTQDGDVPGLFHDDHDLAGHDVERRQPPEDAGLV